MGGLCFSGEHPARIFAAGMLFFMLAGCAVQQESLDAVRSRNREQDAALFAKAVEPLPAPLRLGDAVDYALRNNLEAHATALEKQIREEATFGRRLEMLPHLLATAEQSRRSRDVPSKSINADTGTVSTGSSVSREKENQTASVSLSWNLLDFGVSYFAARQDQNRMQVAEQMERRSRQKLALDVVEAYTKAVESAEAVKTARNLTTAFEGRETILAKYYEQGAAPKQQYLRFKIRTLEIKDILAEAEADLSQRMAKLRELLGVPTDTELDLAGFDYTIAPPEVPDDMRALEAETLMKRPELFQKDLEEAITVDEARKSLVKLLPSPLGFLTYQYDSNDLLSVHDWQTVGLRASWDLFSLPATLSGRQRALLQGEQTRIRRAALSAGVLAQLHMALAEHRGVRAQLPIKVSLTVQYEALAKELAKQREAGEGDEDQRLQEEMRKFAMRRKQVETYMAVVRTREMVYNAIGRDPTMDRGWSALQPLEAPAEAPPPVGRMEEKSLAEAPQPTPTPAATPSNPGWDSIPAVGQAGKSIPAVRSESVRIAFVDDAGSQALRIEAGRELPEPRLMHLDKPDRLVLDFPGHWVNAGPATLRPPAFKDGKLVVGEHSDMLRLVLYLIPGQNLTPQPSRTPSGWLIRLVGKS